MGQARQAHAELAHPIAAHDDADNEHTKDDTDDFNGPHVDGEKLRAAHQLGDSLAAASGNQVDNDIDDRNSDTHKDLQTEEIDQPPEERPAEARVRRPRLPDSAPIFVRLLRQGSENAFLCRLQRVACRPRGKSRERVRGDHVQDFAFRRRLGRRRRSARQRKIWDLALIRRLRLRLLVGHSFHQQCIQVASSAVLR